MLESECSSTILMGILIIKLTPEEDDVMQCHTQAGSIITNIKVKIAFTLPGISAKKILTWNCHVDDSTK